VDELGLLDAIHPGKPSVMRCSSLSPNKEAQVCSIMRLRGKLRYSKGEGAFRGNQYQVLSTEY